MTNISMESSIHVSHDTVSRQVENEEVLLNMASGKYFGLNEIGTEVWSLMKTGANLSRILMHIIEEYEVVPEKAKAELLDLVKDLQRCGLIDIN